MRRPQAKGLAHSVQVRLENQARANSRPVAELVELYAIERFLFRLGRSPHRDDFVLKGGLLLRQWLGADTRPTRDIDLLGPIGLDQERFGEIVADILQITADGDGVEFDVESIAIQPIAARSAVGGMRARFDGRLGPAHLRYQVDVGLGDAVFPATVDVTPGGLLGMPTASLRAYTPYTTIAEKLQAMLVLGEANTRTKDYWDLVALPRALAFDGPTLAEAVRRTLAHRATPVPVGTPDGLTDAFAKQSIHANRWPAFLRKNHLPVTEPDLLAAVVSIRAFAQPILDAVRDDEAFPRRWVPGGPWQSKDSEEGA